MGFSVNPFRQYDDILAALQSLVKSGCRLVYFEGNHDFHMGTVFSRQLGADVHSGPAIMTVQGRRLFLCHGDQINDADYSYRLLRLFLHNRVIAAAIKYISPSLALGIKTYLQRNSRASYRLNHKRWNYREILHTFARSVREKGCDGLVSGHFHLAFCEDISDSPFTILSLGDWMEQYTYGEMVAGTLYLKTYP